MSQKRRQAPPGFSMVEVLVAIAIISFVSLGVATMFNNVDNAVRDASITEARDRIAREIETALLDLTLVTRSAQNGTDADTQALYKCLTPLDKSQPNKCGTEQKGFVMLVKGGGRRLAGPGSNPVYYGRDGAVCKSDSSCRFFRAETYYKATCLSAASNASKRVTTTSCDQASSIELQYQVTPLKPLPSGRMLKPRPASLSMSSITHAISGLRNNQACPPFSTVSGHTPDGRVICLCIAGAVQEPGTPNNDNIKCTFNGEICPAGHVWSGFKDDGAPLCQKRTRECDLKVESNFCKPGGWVESVNIGKCNAVETTAKGGEYDVNCPNMGVKCCYYKDN